MSHPRFHGAIPALTTPFKNGAVDETAFAQLIERQLEAGVHGLVPAGTTGESATLTDAEHRRVLEICVETAAGRVPVIAGAGGSATARVIELVKAAKAAGADAALIAAPPYNRPSQEGLYQHYKAVNDAVDLPIILYNVPSRTSCDIATETVLRLADLPNVVGIKDATADFARVSLMHRSAPDHFALLSGDDPSALGYVAHGGSGVISVTANVAPKAMVNLMEACLAGDFAEARRLQDKLIQLHRALFLDASPSPTKFAQASMGLCSEEVRLPLTICAEAVRPAILTAMREAGNG